MSSAGLQQVAEGRSAAARSLLSTVLAVSPANRRAVLAALDREDLAALVAASDAELGTPWAIWQGDPVGFAQSVGEALWSGQRRILAAIGRHQAVAVPSCFGSGKTHLSGLLAAYWIAVHPPGTATVVTLAPRWRQVIRQVWPEIRGVHNRAGLVGTIDTAQWRIPDPNGTERVVAYGVSASPYSEDAVQGIHAPHLLVIVDEAGGISPTIGRNLRGLLTGSDARMLAIGNPPTDDEGSWFESLCDGDHAHVIRISADVTPAFTGEDTPTCRSCPAAMPEHPISMHLIDRGWVTDAVADNGEDSRYVEAKVHARFPRGGPSTLIPSMWVESAVDADEPADEPAELVALDSLGLPGERARWLVRRGSWVRLGVDVAADGGDELAIARAVGDLVTIERVSAGPDNANSVHVAGVVLEQIRRAEALAAALGGRAPVRVKVDAIGVGWGVAGTLEAWGSEGVHGAEIVRVNVAEGVDPTRQADYVTLKPNRKRDEMWLAGRALVQPRTDVPARVRLRVDGRTARQLSAPRYSTLAAGGQTVVEAKVSMRRRGLRSPDRAEALLLAVYEPGPARRQVRVLA